MVETKKQLTVAFVQSTPSIRIYKLALALKKTGKYKTILLSENNKTKIITEAFNRVIFLNNSITTTLHRRNKLGKFLYKLYRLIPLNIPLLLNFLSKTRNRIIGIRFGNIIKTIEKEVDLFHAVTEPNIIPATTIKNSSKPVIYDVYDFSGIRYGVEKLNTNELKLEKFCLENSDAISMKFPEWILEYYRNLGYKINCPVFNLIDYCLPDFFSFKEKKIDRNNIHIVYSGGLSPSSHPVKYCGNNQYFDILQQIIKQKIYFHIYVPPDKKLYSDYYELGKKNKYLIVHSYKSQPELQKEMSNYHFGCCLNDFSKTEHTKLFEETSFGNKTSTYLEAGLPIIVNEKLSKPT